MLTLRKPSAKSLRQFLADQAKLGFTYAAVGSSATAAPAGYVVDRTRIKLGEGEPVFRAAVAALRQWRQFNLSWVEAWPLDTPIRTGEVVAIVARASGIWWVNACRIVYVIDETGQLTRFGFAYGTLPRHVGTGEERFLIEWDRADGSVWYDILAFSRPWNLLVRLGYPLARRTQKRFGQESAAAMLHAVNERQQVN